MNLDNFKPSGKINVSAAIAEMRSAPGIPHSIIFCRAKDDGKSKPKGGLVMHELLYGGSDRADKERTTNKDGEERAVANIKELGLLPCTIYGTKEYRSILISSIMFFNGKKVVH